MFRRSKQETAPAPVVEKVGGKGRPTPSRKEAQAAAKAWAKAPRTRREQLAAQRSARSESSQRIRQGLKAGEERYLPPRDKGPVKRFIRDFVDSRFSFIELMVPILIVSMLLGYSGNRNNQHNQCNVNLFHTNISFNWFVCLYGADWCW